MARYQVILTYDGTEYRGFQRQAVGRTVQSETEQALQKIGWQGSSILAASRTDSGVHASGQAITFDLDWQHGHRKLRSAINANLPTDIAAQSVSEVHADFHPRFDASSRTYCYFIYSKAVRDPLRDRYSWRVWPGLILDRLETAAEYLLGEHDFAAFGSSPQPGGSTIRTVYRADWKPDGDRLIFEIAANAFLTHMVRRLISFQAAIGQGLVDVKKMQQNLDHPPKTLVQGLAPPQGLFLTAVTFPK